MRNTYVFIVFLTLVVLAVLYGVFQVNGFPVSQRALALDSKRLINFSNLTYSIQDYYSKNGSLPPNLDVLLTVGMISTSSDTTKDPETKKTYEYHTTGKRSYQLCTTFSADYKKQLRTSSYSYPVSTGSDSSKIDYKKGHACIDYVLPSYIYAPTPTQSPNGSAYQEASINILQPTWGSSVCLNQNTKITWKTKGSGLDGVKIGLFTNGTNNKYYDISNLNSFTDSSDGSYTWKAGETATGITLEPGTRYYLIMQATFYGKTVNGYGGEFELKNCTTDKKS